MTCEGADQYNLMGHLAGQPGDNMLDYIIGSR